MMYTSHMSQQHGTKYIRKPQCRFDCPTLLILLTEVQSVKYPADGLCHSSIAQEEANARVLEKKPQEAAETNGTAVTAKQNVKTAW